jgi:hypothetical protein
MHASFALKGYVCSASLWHFRWSESASEWGRRLSGAVRHGAGVLGLLALGVSMGALAEQPQKFLTFDSHVTYPEIKGHANQYVFVWGATGPSLDAAFTQESPGVVLGAYFPYSRDPDAKRGLDYWAASHPTWVAYTCDGATPATMYGDANVTLDVTNTDVVAWQVANFLNRPAGTNAVALDNFQFHNDGRVCGARDASGRFVQRYRPASYDMVYAQDQVRWLERTADLLHAQRVKVVVNHIPDLSPDGDDPASPIIKRMVQSVDGILDEHAQLALRDARKSLLLAKLVSYVEASGKWMYLLYQLDNTGRSSIETAVANYLTMAGPTTAIYVSRNDDAYGYQPDFKGFDRQIGDPCGPATAQHGAVVRRYSEGLAIFAPPGSGSLSVPVTDVYLDVDGATITGSIRLEAGQGRVFYARNGDASGCRTP